MFSSLHDGYRGFGLSKCRWQQIREISVVVKAHPWAPLTPPFPAEALWLFRALSPRDESSGLGYDDGQGLQESSSSLDHTGGAAAPYFSCVPGHGRPSSCPRGPLSFLGGTRPLLIHEDTQHGSDVLAECDEDLPGRAWWVSLCHLPAAPWESWGLCSHTGEQRGAIVRLTHWH